MEPKNGSDNAPLPQPASGAAGEKSSPSEHAGAPSTDAQALTADEPTEHETADEAAAEAHPAERVRPVPLPPVPEQVTELAAMCQRSVLKAVGVRLDFTPETLPLLD